MNSAYAQSKYKILFGNDEIPVKKLQINLGSLAEVKFFARGNFSLELDQESQEESLGLMVGPRSSIIVHDDSNGWVQMCQIATASKF